MTNQKSKGMLAQSLRETKSQPAKPDPAKPKPTLGLSKALFAGNAVERAEVDARLDKVGVPREGAADMGMAQPASGRINSFTQKSALRVRLDELVSNPFNPRTFYIPEKIDDLAVKMQRDGQHEAIKITRNARFPGKYVIVDGEYRSRSKRSLGDDQIEALVLPDLSDKDLYLIANSINTDRTPQTVFDDAIAWQNLLDKQIFPDRSSLAEAIGKELPKVSKTLQLNALPKHLLQRMSAASIGLAHAYNLKLIFERQGEALTEELLARVIDSELSVRSLEEMVKKLDGTSPPRAAKTHYSGNIPFKTQGGRDLGSLKRYRDGRTELKLTGLTEDQQSVLVTQLEKVVHEFVTQHVAEEPSSN